MNLAPFVKQALCLGVLFFAVQLVTASEQPSLTAASDSAAAEQAEMELLMQLAKWGRSVRKVDALADIAGHPFIGDENAEAVLMEFGDFQCPFCRRHLARVMPDLLSEYVNKGRLQYVFRDFPVEDRHADAFQAAVAARCAQEQQKYWDMRKRLYMSATFLKQDNLMEHATEIGLDLPSFESCLNSDRYTETIRNDQKKGISLRVRGTPTFFLGVRSKETGQIRLTSSIIGAQPVEVFRREIEQIVNGEKLSASEH